MAASAAREPIAVDAPVAEVTLLEDRAHVVRRAVVMVPAGITTVRIDEVAPVLSDKTLVVQVASAGTGAEGETALTVVDARVRRRAVVRLRDVDEPDGAEPSEKWELEKEQDELEARLERRRAKYAILERHAAGIEEIAAQTYADLASDVSWGREIGGEWSRRLEQLHDRERELRSRLVDLAHEIEELEREEERLQVRIDAVDNRAEVETAALEIEVSAAREGEYPLRIDYVVPGACWRPYHTARLIEGEARRVVFSTDACVWQNTGEDWHDAQLVFSTERPSLGTEPPELESDLLRWKKKSEAIVVETREQEVETVGLGAAPMAVAPELPGIDDGGETLSFRAPAGASVPSDGKPYRVELSVFESEAEVELITMPELDPSVILRTTQANAGKRPILAGPVDLIRENGFVGRTSVLFVAAGERFELGWGPDAELRVKRVCESTQEKSRRLSSWVRREHEVKVRLSNLGAKQRTIEVTERVPVSEIDKVKIEVEAKEVTDGQLPDEHGFLRWTVSLPPFGHETVELRYRLRKHEDVVGI